MGKGKETLEDFSYKPFKNLNDIIRNKGIQLSREKPKNAGDVISDEELFAFAMSDVKEFKEFRRIATENKRPPTRISKVDPDQRALNSLLNLVKGKDRFNLRNTQEYVEWLNPKYSAAYRSDTASKLHEGVFAVQDYIDMHGLTLDHAEVEVDKFLNDSLIKGLRCIKFIHGRGLRSPSGTAVLKDALIEWLMGRYHKHVIAFATAPYNNGGLGALYVLLRKRKTR